MIGREEYGQAQSLAVVHLNPANILKRTEFRWAQPADEPAKDKERKESEGRVVMGPSWKDNHAPVSDRRRGSGLACARRRALSAHGEETCRDHVRICRADLPGGLYIGSIGVIDPVNAKPWYAAQVMNSPLVILLGRVAASGNYPVYGRAGEIGQIYTSVAGLLNLLCVVNAIYVAHQRTVEETKA